MDDSDERPLKAVKLDRAYWPGGGVGYWCPGCGNGHEVATETAWYAGGPVWGFNGDFDRPTITPSVNIRWGTYADPTYVDEDGFSGICHHIVTDGRIQFCSDSTHALSGQTVDLPDVPADKYLTSQRLTRKGG